MAESIIPAGRCGTNLIRRMKRYGNRGGRSLYPQIVSESTRRKDGRTSQLNHGRLDMANREYVVMQSIGHDRREFISKSFCLAGTASLAAFGVRRAAAQAQGTLPPIQRSQRYDDSFITQRKPFKWPGNNTIAVWFALNVAVWQYNSAIGVAVSL